MLCNNNKFTLLSFLQNDRFYTVSIIFTSVNIVFTAVISHTVHGLNCWHCYMYGFVDCPVTQLLYKITSVFKKRCVNFLLSPTVLPHQFMVLDAIERLLFNRISTKAIV